MGFESRQKDYIKQKGLVFMKIIIAGDLVPTKHNYLNFTNSLVRDLVDDELINILSESNLVIANLETPLTNIKNPIKKCGPCLSAPEDTINGIKALGIDFVTLANNHIMDQGEKGLKRTIELLETNGILYAGAGNNINEVKPFHTYNIEGKIIGIFCCAENEFSIATKNCSGANPFDPLETPDLIKSYKDKCDFLIVLYHGGKEHYRYPSPNLMKVCRKIADRGADLIVVQHSHCVGTRENYNGTEIIYGQGNFIFNLNQNEYWNNALLIEINITNNNVSYNYIPIEQNGSGVKISKDQSILKGFHDRENNLNEDLLEANYSEFAKNMLAEYEIASLGKISKNIFIRALNKLFKHRLTHLLFSERHRLVLIDFLRCDAHRELWLKGLEETVDKKQS